MKLLLDENLSRKLGTRLAKLYPGSSHVTEVGLQAASDREIWEYVSEDGTRRLKTPSMFYGEKRSG